MSDLLEFVRESNVIAGATEEFLALDEITLDALFALQSVYAPEERSR